MYRLLRLLLFVSLIPLAAMAGKVDARQVQVAYIYNFAKFIQWPQRSKHLSVCVYGDSELEAPLRKLSNRAVNRRKIDVVKSTSIDAIKECQIVILPDLDPEQLAQVKEVAKRYHVVTISDRPGYAENGIMINFFIDHKRVRFAINHLEAQKADIKISSKLLRVAKVINNEH